MNTDSAVSCEGLHFTYDGEPSPVLRGLSIDIGRGEFAVIAGPSGAGKSTFCRTLNNIIPLFFRGALTGRRCVDGEWLEKQSVASLSSRIGMVFQDFEQQLFSTNSTLELSFAMENFGVPAAEMRERIADLAALFGIAQLLQREPFSLSGGEKQKLAIASVMASRPRILVLDEPTTDLDPDSRDFVLQVIPQLKDWVETVILIDHETEQFRHANRIHLLREGAIQAAGDPYAILQNSALLQ
ncbi:MAG TPA: ABC transporter ATP-binding protein, partial [Acidobacteriota bacterium]|nr:ABC transporter ATP-binding protein [Acidobacteriota bacterium]